MRPSQQQPHFDMRNAVFQKFIGNLYKALLFVQPAGIGLRFQNDAVRAEFFSCGPDALFYKQTSDSAAPIDRDDPPQRNLLKGRTFGQDAQIGHEFSVLPGAEMESRCIESVYLLIGAVLLHHENRDAEFIDLK